MIPVPDEGSQARVGAGDHAAFIPAARDIPLETACMTPLLRTSDLPFVKSERRQTNQATLWRLAQKCSVEARQAGTEQLHGLPEHR